MLDGFCEGNFLLKVFGGSKASFSAGGRQGLGMIPFDETPFLSLYTYV